jgi:hypothetical protein
MALDKDADLSWSLACSGYGATLLSLMKIKQRKSETRKNFVKYN